MEQTVVIAPDEKVFLFVCKKTDKENVTWKATKGPMSQWREKKITVLHYNINVISRKGNLVKITIVIVGRTWWSNTAWHYTYSLIFSNDKTFLLCLCLLKRWCNVMDRPCVYSCPQPHQYFGLPSQMCFNEPLWGNCQFCFGCAIGKDVHWKGTGPMKSATLNCSYSHRYLISHLQTSYVTNKEGNGKYTGIQNWQ